MNLTGPDPASLTVSATRGALAKSSFGTRLLLALAIVVVSCAVSAWLVASALAPGIFHDHLGQAGIDHDSNEASHVEEAFTVAIVLAWGLAVAVAVVLALLVSWYFTRRVQRSVTAVTATTADIAGGHYGTRIVSPGLGREFDQLADSVNELARRLDATEATRRRMLADLGHEMRTPIATLDSYLEAVDDGVRDFDEDTRRVLWSATQRLERLTADIVDVSYADEHYTHLHRVSTTTGVLIASSASAAREQYEHKGVELRVQITESAVLSADADRMDQVLGNLLNNALRHTRAGGLVTITGTRGEGGIARIVVADTGDGITNEHMDHIFDRFYRVDAARGRHGGGSGIGLTITRSLVEAHGGRISAHSDGLGQGAHFTVDIPAQP